MVGTTGLTEESLPLLQSLRKGMTQMNPVNTERKCFILYCSRRSIATMPPHQKQAKLVSHARDVIVATAHSLT